MNKTKAKQTAEDKNLYAHICKKYPSVVYKTGESLNIEKMHAREIFLRWHNVDKYPTIEAISRALGISERTIYRIAKQRKMGSRHCIKELT